MTFKEDDRKKMKEYNHFLKKLLNVNTTCFNVVNKDF